MKVKIFTLFFALIFMVGCSTKSSGLYNLRPEIWYNHIMADIKANDLKEADKHYNQFASEHVASPLLEPTLLVMALANADEGRYTRANELLDEYIRRYGTKEQSAY